MQLIRAFFAIVVAMSLRAEASGGNPPVEEPSRRGPPFGHTFEPLSSSPSTEASRRGSSDSRLLGQLRKNLRPRRQSLWEGPWEYVAAALARPLNVLFMPGAILGSLEAAGALQFDAGTERPAQLLASRGAPRGAPSYGHAFEPLEKCEDCSPGTRASIWADRSAGPVAVDMLLALAWIGCVASSPALMRRWEGEPATKNHLVFGGGALLALLGCLCLFTQVVLFRSTRFEAVRTLTAIECVYLMSQIVTTVGYGDITPAEPLGKAFVGLTVVASVFAASLFVSEIVSRILAAVSRYKQSLVSIADRVLASEYDVSSGGVSRSPQGAASVVKICGRPPKVDRLVNSFAVFAFLALTWALFFRLCPGERKSLAEAAYMSLITLSTVGFGAVVPATDAGRVFAAFWMPLGTAALLSLFGALAEYVVGRAEFERYDAVGSRHAFAAFKKDLGGSDPSEVEFMSFALQQRQLCGIEKVEELRRAFKAMGPSVRHGTIPLATFKRELRILG